MCTDDIARYSTDIFGFGTRQNGFLISLNSMLRGMFLTFIFPRIIAWGRARLAERQKQETKNYVPTEESEPISPAPSQIGRAHV